MKRMLSIALVASMMLIGTSSFAQTISAGFGYLNTTQKLSALGYHTNVPMNGLYAGFDYAYELGNGFSIAPGVYYKYASAPAKAILNMAGVGDIISELLDGWVKARLDEHYIDIPVNFNFRTTLSDSIKGFIYAGPTFSLGLSSMIKAEALGVKIDACNNYKHDYFNEFDVLLGGGIGLDFSDSYRFTVGYNFGMFNRLGKAIVGESGSDNVTLNRNELHVGLAYLF